VYEKKARTRGLGQRKGPLKNLVPLISEEVQCIIRMALGDKFRPTARRSWSLTGGDEGGQRRFLRKGGVNEGNEKRENTVGNSNGPLSGRSRGKESSDTANLWTRRVGGVGVPPADEYMKKCVR